LDNYILFWKKNEVAVTDKNKEFDNNGKNVILRRNNARISHVWFLDFSNYSFIIE